MAALDRRRQGHATVAPWVVLPSGEICYASTAAGYRRGASSRASTDRKRVEQWLEYGRLSILQREAKTSAGKARKLMEPVLLPPAELDVLCPHNEIQNVRCDPYEQRLEPLKVSVIDIEVKKEVTRAWSESLMQATGNVASFSWSVVYNGYMMYGGTAWTLLKALDKASPSLKFKVLGNVSQWFDSLIGRKDPNTWWNSTVGSMVSDTLGFGNSSSGFGRTVDKFFGKHRGGQLTQILKTGEVVAITGGDTDDYVTAAAVAAIPNFTGIDLGFLSESANNLWWRGTAKHSVNPNNPVSIPNLALAYYGGTTALAKSFALRPNSGVVGAAARAFETVSGARALSIPKDKIADRISAEKDRLKTAYSERDAKATQEYTKALRSYVQNEHKRAAETKRAYNREVQNQTQQYQALAQKWDADKLKAETEYQKAVNAYQAEKNRVQRENEKLRVIAQKAGVAQPPPFDSAQYDTDHAASVPTRLVFTNRPDVGALLTEWKATNEAPPNPKTDAEYKTEFEAIAGEAPKKMTDAEITTEATRTVELQTEREKSKALQGVVSVLNSSAAKTAAGVLASGLL